MLPHILPLMRTDEVPIAPHGVADLEESSLRERVFQCAMRLA